MHNPGSLISPRTQRSGTNHDDNSHSTLGNIKQLRLQVRKAERGDDEVRKDPQPANDERRGQLEHDVEPHDRVGEGLDGLVALVDPVLDARLVGAHALHHEALLVLVEALGLHGRVREPPPDEEAPGAGQAAEDEEEELPGQDFVADVLRHAPGYYAADLRCVSLRIVWVASLI